MGLNIESKAMKIAGTVIDVIEGIVSGYQAIVLQRPERKISPISCEDETTFFSERGELITLFTLSGFCGLVGDNERLSTFEIWRRVIAPRLETGELEIMVTFENDPDAIESKVREMVAPSMKQAKHYGFDLDYVFEEKIQQITRDCSYEETIIAVKTSHLTESKAAAKTEAKERAEELADAPISIGSQPHPGLARTNHKQRHDETIMVFEQMFKESGHEVKRLTVGEAFKVWVGQLYGYSDSQGVELNSQFSDYQGRAGDLDNPANMGAYYPKRISEQLFIKPIYNVGNNVELVGDRIVSVCQVSLMPKSPKIFERFLKKMKDDRIGFRMSFNLKPNPYVYMGIKRGTAAFFGGMGFGNIKKISNAIKAGAIYESKGGCMVGTSILVTTWEKAEPRFDIRQKKEYFELKGIKEKITRIIARINNWGGMEANSIVPDTLEGIIKGCSGLNMMPLAPITPMPIEEAMGILPTMRPTTAWSHGSLVFQSEDGRIMPYQQFSDKQPAWITAVSGPMGFGKSNTMAIMNFDLIFKPNATNEMPMIRGLDVGRTQSGLVNMLRSGMKGERKNVALHITYMEHEKFSNNPLDTYVGQRKPTKQQSNHTVALIKTLLTDLVDSRDAPPVLTDLINMALKVAYDFCTDFEDNPTAKAYQLGVSKYVDQALKRHNIVVPDKAKWWTVCDELANRGDMVNAERATRQAVPLMADVAAAVRSDVVKQEYKEEYNGAALTDTISRMLLAAVDDFPTLTRATCIDVSRSKVVFFDLTTVLMDGDSRDAHRRNAVNYLMVSKFLMRDIALDPRTVEVEVKQEPYRSYLIKKGRNILAAEARWFDDEWHRYKNVSGANEGKVITVREGRKSRVDILTGSQLMQDQPKALLKLATTKIFCGIGGEDDLKETIEAVPLSQSKIDRLKNISAPNGSKGAELLIEYDSKKKKGLSMSAFLKAGGNILWELSTHSEDRELREELARRVGQDEARRLLVQKFPSGSALEEISRRIAEQDEDDNANIIYALASEIETMSR